MSEPHSPTGDPSVEPLNDERTEDRAATHETIGGEAAAVQIVCADEQDEEPVDTERFARLAAEVLSHEGISGELTLTFVDRAEMAALNTEHLGKTGPTDVLSFPLDVPDGPHPVEHADASTPSAEADGRTAGVATGGAVAPRLLGDVVVCPAVAREQSPTHAGTYDDELALLVVHGILHVLGWDHAEAEETRAMRERERRLLAACFWDGDVPTGFRQVHDDEDEP